MKYVCDAPKDQTWFMIETQLEAEVEAAAMQHAVDKHFRAKWDEAAQSFKPASRNFVEQEIGLVDHVARVMPRFVTLRTADGAALATAMVPPKSAEAGSLRPVIVGHANADPYVHHAEAIDALAKHLGFDLVRERCYPYARR